MHSLLRGCFLQGWPLAAVPALSTAMPFPFSLVLLVWYLGLKTHLAGGSECCEEAAPACVCQKATSNSVSQNSCPSSHHEYSGCNTKFLSGPRGCRKLVLALAVSAWLPVCLRAASGEFLGSLEYALHLCHPVGLLRPCLTGRERARAKLPVPPVSSLTPVPMADQTFSISIDLHLCPIRFFQSGTISSLMPDGKFINMNS